MNRNHILISEEIKPITRLLVDCISSAITVRSEDELIDFLAEVISDIYLEKIYAER